MCLTTFFTVHSNLYKFKQNYLNYILEWVSELSLIVWLHYLCRLCLIPRTASGENYRRVEPSNIASIRTTVIWLNPVIPSWKT